MIYLLLAITSSALVSIIMRISEKHVNGNVSMLAMNYIMCMTMAGAYSGFANLLPDTEGIGLTLGLGIFNGILYLLGFILLQVNVKKNGVVLSATFMKLGLLVPMVVSICFFHEIPEFVQVIGFLIAVGAIILINFEKEDTNAEFKAGLILVLLAGGGGDAMSKVFEEVGNPALSEHFLFYTFVVAFILCIGLVMLRKEKAGKREVFFGFLIGIPNYFSARFLLKSLENVPAVIAYPTYSVATIVVVTLVGTLLFKEKLSRKQGVAITGILFALILLNI